MKNKTKRIVPLFAAFTLITGAGTLAHNPNGNSNQNSGSAGVLLHLSNASTDSFRQAWPTSDLREESD